MLGRSPVRFPRRILMTLDAVGGIWRYALDTARILAAHGVECVLVGLGPRPSPHQRAEVAALEKVELVWIDCPLEWMIDNEMPLHAVSEHLARIADGSRV